MAQAPTLRKTKSLIDVTPRQLLTLLKIAIRENLRVLICGEPGCGKSEIMAQACAEEGVDLLLSHPVTEDPTAVCGMPDLRSGDDHATFKPFGTLYKALNATRRTIWGLDDFGNAANMVQGSYMQFIQAGRLNDYVLPSNVTIWAATNERTHKTGVSGILEAVKDRFDLIVRLVANLEDSKKWFYDKGLPTEIPAFWEMRPDLLSHFDPQGDMDKSPSPRSWAKCAKWVELALKGQLPSDLQLAAYAGCVGPGAGGELKAHLDHLVDMPDLPTIIKDPSKTAIPSNPSVLYAVCTGLAYRASVDNWANIIKYSQRLHDDGKTEFAALLLQDSIAREGGLASIDNKDFMGLSSTPLGRILIGKGA